MDTIRKSLHPLCTKNRSDVLIPVVQIGKTLEAVKELERRIGINLIDSISGAKL